MRIKKLRKGVDLNLKTKKSKYVIDTASEDPKLPALFVLVGRGGLVRLIPVLPCANTLKKWGTPPELFLSAQPKCPMIYSKI